MAFASGLGEILPGTLLDILAFGGQNNLATGDILVNASNAAVFSNSFPLRRGVTYAWEVTFTSPGSVVVKVELEQGNQRPATEGATDTSWAVPDNKTASPMFSSITDTNMHSAAYSPNASAFGRLKLTGSGANNAGTKLHVARAYGIKTV